MADIPGFPYLMNITPDHQAQATALIESVKASNPEHAEFLDKLGDHIKAGAEEVGVAIVLAAMLPFMRDNSFM